MKIRSLIALFILILGILGVTSTYTRLSYTADEISHNISGMEWWKDGTYKREPKHAPLGRIFEAALPYFLDAQGPKAPGMVGMSSYDAYIYKGILMRVGNLPFYILSVVMVWAWSRKLFGETSALWSIALYVTLSNVSAHAGVATTDMPYTATLMCALLSGWNWIEKPSVRHAALLGLSLGLMIGSKFSGLLQWPAAMALMIAAHAIANYRLGHKINPLQYGHLTTTFYTIFPSVLFTLGVIYRFDFDPLYQGIRDLRDFNHHGFAIWLFQRLNNQAVWYFFPVVFLYKTPIGFLAGVLHAQLRITEGLKKRHTAVVHFFPLLAAIGVMLPSMFSNINLGVRHVLPVYPLLSIPAGFGLYYWWRLGEWKRAFAALCVAWQIAGFVAWWPDHVSYYNELGGDHPETISPDSDFDWGQDLVLLKEAVDAYGIDKIYVCVRGFKISGHSIDMLLGDKAMACTNEPVTGWIVVSRVQRMFKPEYFAWLYDYEAVQRIGSTLDLYYIPPEAP